MALLTLARDLRRRKARDRHHLFVAEGVRAVEELLASPLAVRGLLATPSLGDTPRGAALLARAAEGGVPVESVGEREFASAADTDTPQGVLAVAAVPQLPLADLVARASAPAGRLLVLDALQDPGNVGTILRTAAAFGAVGAVALPGTVDLWNAKVVRGAMGALFRLPTVAASLDELCPLLGAHRVPLWGAAADGESLDGGRGTVTGPLAIAVGNEGAGLSPALLAAADRTVAIPIAPGVESLNVAVAAGILLFALRA